MGRTIDYGMTRGTRPRSVTAHGKRGSDHRLVVFVLDVDGVRFRIGLWNLRHGRDRGRVAKVAVRLLGLFDLDALALCEAQDYFAQLRRAARAAGHAMIGYDDPRGAAHQVILVRDGWSGRRWCSWTGARLWLMTRTGWLTAARGKATPPKWAPTVRLVVLGRSLRLVAGHRPPTQRWRRGRMTGPVRRVIATRQHARNEVEHLDDVTAPWLYVADFNAEPHQRGRWSPAWVAAQLDAQLIAPKGTTHG